MDRENGFTLIELMVTLIVAAILLTVAVPNFSRLVESNRVTGAANELVGALNAARSEAVRAGADFVMCASSDGQECSGDWQDGWLVFLDADDDGEVDDPDTDIVRVRGAFPGLLELTGSENEIRYSPRGLRLDPSGSSSIPPVNFTIAPRGCSGNQQREIEVSPIGGVRLEVTECP